MWLSVLKSIFYVLRFYLIIVAAVVSGIAWIFYFAGVTREHWSVIEYLCAVPLVFLLLLYSPDIIRRIRKHSEIVEETEEVEPEDDEPSSVVLPNDYDLIHEIQHLENPCSGERRAGFELAKQVIAEILRNRR